MHQGRSPLKVFAESHEGWSCENVAGGGGRVGGGGVPGLSGLMKTCTPTIFFSEPANVLKVHIRKNERCSPMDGQSQVVRGSNENLQKKRELKFLTIWGFRKTLSFSEIVLSRQSATSLS